jgi:hypothetical protein
LRDFSSSFIFIFSTFFPVHLSGEVDAKEKLTRNVVFLYPNLSTAILATYQDGRMAGGTYARLQTASIPPPGTTSDMLPQLSFRPDSPGAGRPMRDDDEGTLRFDPSTFMRISRTPLDRDGYESQTVRVGPSNIPMAGEGLFATRPIGKAATLFTVK